MEVMQTYRLPFLSETEKQIHCFFFTGMLTIYYYYKLSPKLIKILFHN